MISSPNQYGLEDEQISIECVVQSIPKAASVVWHRNGQEINLDNKNGYELITEALPDTDSMDSMIRHLLVIRHAKPIDFGQYNCSATNELGTDSILITLNKQSKCFFSVFYIPLFFTCKLYFNLKMIFERNQISFFLIFEQA